LCDQRLKRRAAERDALAGVLARFGDLVVTGAELLSAMGWPDSR
jgi:hypothetical protein